MPTTAVFETMEEPCKSLVTLAECKCGRSVHLAGINGILVGQAILCNPGDGLGRRTLTKSERREVLGPDYSACGTESGVIKR
jgi:hypothetical protein